MNEQTKEEKKTTNGCNHKIQRESENKKGQQCNLLVSMFVHVHCYQVQVQIACAFYAISLYMYIVWPCVVKDVNCECTKRIEISKRVRCSHACSVSHVLVYFCVCLL